MSNLLRETLEVLKSNGKKQKDVLWVGNINYYFSWGKFKKLANKKYDGGFGSEEVATDLLVVGENWWLERHEYDGSEWWEFKQLPKKPKVIMEVKTLFVSGNGDELEEINKGGK